jgi:uncharacterized protein YjbI with pentapeptide repeats
MSNSDFTNNTNCLTFFRSHQSRFALVKICVFLTSIERIQFTFFSKINLNLFFKYIKKDQFFKVREYLQKYLVYMNIRDNLNDNAKYAMTIINLIKKNLQLNGQETEEYFTIWLNKFLIKSKNDDEKKTLDLSNLSLRENGTLLTSILLSINDTFETVNLTNSNLDSSSMEYLKNIINDKKWVSLTLSDNNLNATPAFEIFPYLKALKILRLTNTSICPKTTISLVENLPFLSNLEYIYLDKNPLDDKSCNKILETLCLLNFLQLICLSDCKIENITANLKRVFLKCQNLNQLDLSHNNLEKKLYTDIQDNLLRSSLRKVNFSNCNLTNKEGAILLKALQHNKFICEIDMTLNPLIDILFAPSLIEFIESNKNIRKIYILTQRFREITIYFPIRINKFEVVYNDLLKKTLLSKLRTCKVIE